MKRLMLLTACSLLAACAQVPTNTGGLGPEARSADSEDPRARIHTELAAQYYLIGNYAVALQNLNVALEADAGHAPAHHVLGLVHGELRQDAQAEADFKRALALSPKYSEAYTNYGRFLCQRDRYDEAFKQFEAALANPLYESPDKALANAGICSARKGDLKAAEQYLQMALRRAPGQTLALASLADVHYRLDRLTSTRELLRQLSATTELSAASLWLGLRTERRLGDQVAEASYATMLRRRYPDSQEYQWLITGQFDKSGGDR